jgi:hypothetical protein
MQLPDNALLATLTTQSYVGGKTYYKRFHLENYRVRRKSVVTDIILPNLHQSKKVRRSK